jgi:hypothetical protein
MSIIATVKEGQNAGEWVEERIHQVFMDLAELVAQDVFDLDHPAPIIRASMHMTNAWQEYMQGFDNEC